MTRALTEDEFVALIRRTIDEKFGGVQSDAARAWQVSISYLNDVIHKRRQPGVMIYGALGFKRLVSFVRD